MPTSDEAWGDWNAESETPPRLGFLLRRAVDASVREAIERAAHETSELIDKPRSDAQVTLDREAWNEALRMRDHGGYTDDEIAAHLNIHLTCSDSDTPGRPVPPRTSCTERVSHFLKARVTPPDALMMLIDRIYAYGWRVSFLSMFPNIYRVEPGR